MGRATGSSVGLLVLSFEGSSVVRNWSAWDEVKTGAVLSYGVIFIQFLVALLYTPVMLRLLGPNEFGLYSLVSAVVGYLSLISFGFAGAYLRFYSQLRVTEDWRGVRRLNGLFLTVFSALGLFAALGGVALIVSADSVLGDAFTAKEVSTARVLFGVLVVNLVASFLTTVFNSYVIAHERFIFQRLLLIAGTVVSPLLALPLLLIGYNSVGVAVATTVVNVILNIITVVYSRLRLNMHFAFRGLSYSQLRDVSVFSGFLFLNMLVDQVNWNADRYIIGRFQGAAAVAVYGVASILNLSYMSISTAISGVLAPRVNRMVASTQPAKEIGDLFVRVGRVQFLVLGFVVTSFVFFGRAFIEMWAGSDYGDSYIIAVVLMVSVTIPLIQNLGIEIQKAKNLHHFRSWVYGVVALGNIALSIPLTQRYGGIGAATGTAVSLILGNVILMNWYYHTRVGLDIVNFGRQILRLSVGVVPAVLVGAVLVLAVDLSRLSVFLVSGLTYFLTYASGVWWLGMNDYERELFGLPVRRLMRCFSRRGGIWR